MEGRVGSEGREGIGETMIPCTICIYFCTSAGYEKTETD